MQLPQLADVTAVRARIAPWRAATPLQRSDALQGACGAAGWFKCEDCQLSGAFKYRGALNAVWSLTDAEAARGVVTHSAGHHGAASTLAARTRGIHAHIVVPAGAVPAKIANIENAGGIVHFCAPTTAAREAAAATLGAETGATPVHPHADPRVIAGQGTAALEVLDVRLDIDLLLTPIGGGGLVSGSASAAVNIVPDTVCDGLRATIGAIDLALLQQHAVRVLPVNDAEVVAAMELLYRELGEIVEPSSATVLAALLRHRGVFAGHHVAAILTGGNVDRAAWPWLEEA